MSILKLKRKARFSLLRFRLLLYIVVVFGDKHCELRNRLRVIRIRIQNDLKYLGSCSSY